MSPKRFAIFAAALSISCTDLDSSDIKTAGISAYLTVDADGSGQTTAQAQFLVDSSFTDFVELDQGDTVVAKTGAQSETMAETNLLGIVTYSAAFTGADAAGTQYTISLTRPADTSAPSSSATLPAPFAITAPSGNGLTYSRANDDITVTISSAASSDPLTWNATGTCANASGQLSGSNTFVIPKGSIVGSNGGGNCQVSLLLQRARSGSLDPAYYGGTVIATQTRTLNFTSAP